MVISPLKAQEDELKTRFPAMYSDYLKGATMKNASKPGTISYALGETMTMRWESLVQETLAEE